MVVSNPVLGCGLIPKSDSINLVLSLLTFKETDFTLKNRENPSRVKFCDIRMLLVSLCPQSVTLLDIMLCIIVFCISIFFTSMVDCDN